MALYQAILVFLILKQVELIFGGNITTYLGGYNTKKVLYGTMITSVLCQCSAAPIAFINNFPLFVALLWMLLFFDRMYIRDVIGVVMIGIDPALDGNAVYQSYCYDEMLGKPWGPGTRGMVVLGLYSKKIQVSLINSSSVN